MTKQYKSKRKYTIGFTGDEDDWRGYVEFKIWGIIPVRLDEYTLRNMLQDARASGPQIHDDIQSIMRNEG